MIGLDRTPFTGEKRGDLVDRLKKYSKDKRVEHIYQICYTPNKNYKPIKINRKVTLIPTNSPAKLSFVVDVLILSKYLEFDVITTQDVEVCGLAGTWLKHKTRKPLVVNFFTIKTKGWFLNKVEKFVLNSCDLVRVESQTQKDRLLKSGFKKPIIIAPLGFDLNKFKPPKVRTAKNTVLFVGRLSPEKNVEMILKAAEVLDQVKFVIIGDGTPDYKASLHEMGGDNVQFKGLVAHDKLKKYYDNANILVLTSKFEGVPTVIVEAMSNGLPIISTDLPDVRNIIDSGITGFIIPQNNVKALAGIINATLKNKSMEREMGKAGRKRVLELFGEDNVVKTVVDGWKSVLK